MISPHRPPKSPQLACSGKMSTSFSGVGKGIGGQNAVAVEAVVVVMMRVERFQLPLPYI